MTLTDPRTRVVNVKTDVGTFLLAYHLADHSIELHRKGITYRIPLFDLIEFGRTSERTTFRVSSAEPLIDEGDDVISQEFE